LIAKEAQKVKSKSTKQIQVYMLDLTKIVGKGDFLCPRCGTEISPDDETEENYSILEAKVNNSGLEEVIICCNKCKSEIHLTGFSIMQKLLGEDENKSTQEKDAFCYITHV
jgi:phage terminase large subunit GpA-like protein